MTFASPARIHWALLAFGITPFFFNGYINARIASDPVLYWSFEAFCWVALPILILVAGWRLGAFRLPDIGFHGTVFGRRNVGLLVVIALLLCPVYQWIYSSSYNYFSTILPTSSLFQYHEILPSPGPWRTLTAIYLALTAGPVEESYFRGLALRACQLLPYSMPLYLLSSPLLFALIHWESGAANTAASYIVGVFTVAIYLGLRNLWPLVVAHAYTDYAWFL